MEDRFLVKGGENVATLFSTCRMQHPSRKMPSARKEKMDIARKELRSALENIKACSGKIIEGVYSSQIDGSFDVENIVFYNIDTAAFRNASQYGLRARRCRLADESASLGFRHSLSYRLIPTPAVPLSLLAQLCFVPTGLETFEVWWAAGGGEGSGFGPVVGKYGLYVELADPKPSKNPARLIKGLFDGIIASLQPDLSPDVEAINRLSIKHEIAHALIEARLKNPLVSVIPESPSKRLVRAQRSEGVQWYPADDLCEECTIVVSSSPVLMCYAYVYAFESDGRSIGNRR